MQYKSGAERNSARLASSLGGACARRAVQRSGNRVRVNAQLIDARTDRHPWAQTYDHDLADVFAIQSEIAKAIADQLQAKLSYRKSNASKRYQPGTRSIRVLFAGQRSWNPDTLLEIQSCRAALQASD
jgi:hypothetical protein